MVQTGTSYLIRPFRLSFGDVYEAQLVLINFLIANAENYCDQMYAIEKSLRWHDNVDLGILLCPVTELTPKFEKTKTMKILCASQNLLTTPNPKP